VINQSGYHLSSCPKSGVHFFKMAPIVKALEDRKSCFKTKVCVTAQHREMLDQVLTLFEIAPDYDLDIMQPNQSLSDITSNILNKMECVLDDFEPDIMLVHGDTTTTFTASLAGFYKKIFVGHVEAGLRTGDIYSPWPEEANRKLTSVIANFHFSPTQKSKENLINENVDSTNIEVTGNTVIDAMMMVLRKIESNHNLRNRLERILHEYGFARLDRKFILITGHRRENFGDGFLNICAAINELALNNPNVEFVYPVHLNSNVERPAREILSNIPNVTLIEPLQYEVFIYLMSKSYLILTDSGGIQEEAPSLGKPVLVMRDTTERPEAIEAGTVKLVGSNKKMIVQSAQELIDNQSEYKKMSHAHNPFGDGSAAKKIVESL